MTAVARSGNNYHVTPNRTKRSGLSGARIDELCVRFEEQCRERGLRRTPQRLAVYRALARDPGHPSAEEVHRRLRREMPSLSLATVYRTLDSLAREGFARRLGGGGGGARFDADPQAHQHLVCRACGRLTDVRYGPLSALEVPRGEIDGFLAEAIEIRIIGLCRRCRPGRAAAMRSQKK